MDQNYAKNCYDYHSYWGVGSVVVVDDFAVDFVVHFVDCWGGRIVGWNCYFGDYHIVGVVVDSSIVVVVGMVGDWRSSFGYYYGYSFVGFHYCGYCRCGADSFVNTVVGNCGSGCCHKGVDY